MARGKRKSARGLIQENRRKQPVRQSLDPATLTAAQRRSRRRLGMTDEEIARLTERVHAVKPSPPQRRVKAVVPKTLRVRSVVSGGLPGLGKRH